MPFYKILKMGHFSEAWLNEVGKVVDLSPEVAQVAVERGFLIEVKKKPIKPPIPIKAKKKKK